MPLGATGIGHFILHPIDTPLPVAREVTGSPSPQLYPIALWPRVLTLWCGTPDRTGLSLCMPSLEVCGTGVGRPRAIDGGSWPLICSSCPLRGMTLVHSACGAGGPSGNDFCCHSSDRLNNPPLFWLFPLPCSPRLCSPFLFPGCRPLSQALLSGDTAYQVT